MEVPSHALHIRQTRTSCTTQAIGQSPGDLTADMLLPVGVTTYTEARSSNIADALLTIYQGCQHPYCGVSAVRRYTTKM